MDLCGTLGIVAVFLILLTIVGHGLWVLAALIGQALFGGPHQQSDLPRRFCLRCGTAFAGWREECPECGLDPKGKLARELRELEKAARQIQDLVEKGVLDAAVGEQVYQKIEAKQAKLLQGPSAEPPPVVVQPLSAQPLSADEQKRPPELAPAALVVPKEASKPATPPAQSAEISAPVAAQAESTSKRRSWGELLAGFMEERNILWGELVGGLLIVGCSIALVISLWRTLEEIPYFPFLIFAAITASLFGAGLYTLSHWKLESTSRGLLVIATLLTPLDFLVLAGLSKGRSSGIVDWVTELSALVGFTVLIFHSARILVGRARAPAEGGQDTAIFFTVAVIGASATQLLVPRWLDVAEPVAWLFVVLSLAPVLFEALAVGLAVTKLARAGPLDVSKANKLYLFLGPTMFAVVVALGFIVYWSDDPLWAVRHLAVAIAVAAWPLLFCGAFVIDRLVDVPAASSAGFRAAEEPGVTRGLSPALARLVGMVIALVGVSVMLAALGPAWPRPTPLILISGLNAAVLAGVALGMRLPYAHVPSLACLAISVVIGFHGLRGELSDENVLSPRLLALAISPATGVVLTVLAGLLVLASEIFLNARRRLDGLVYILAAGVFGSLAVLLVNRAGTTAPGRAAIVFGLCGLGGILVNARWQRAWLTRLGSLVMLGAIAYTVYWWNPAWPPSRRWLLALLVHATLLLACSLFLQKWDRYVSAAIPKATQVFIHAFQEIALVGSLLALWPLRSGLEWHWLPASTVASMWLAGLWLLLAWNRLWPWLFAASQAAVTLAVVMGTSSWLHEHNWVGDQVDELWHDYSLQAFGLALAALSLGWVLVRWTLRKNTRALALLEPGWRGVDWVVVAGVVFGHLTLTAIALWPEVLREIAPVQLHGDVARMFQAFPQLDVPMASTLAGLLALILLASLWGRRPTDALFASVLWAVTLAGTLAYVWREQMAVASMLRWALAVVFVVCSILIWTRNGLQRLGRGLGIVRTDDWNVARWSRVVLLALAMTPVLVMSVLVAVVGFYGRQPAGPGAGTLFAWMGWTANVVIPLLLLTSGLVGHGARENAPSYLFAAGLLLLATLTGGHALSVVTGGGAVDAREGVFLAQLGALELAVWALVWLGSGRWRSRGLLAMQTTLALAVMGILLGLALVELLSHVAGAWPASVLQMGSPVAWLGLIGSVVAALWVIRLWVPSLGIQLLGVAGLSIGILLASLAAPTEPTGWRAYHVLTLAWTLAALGMLTLSWTASASMALGPAFWSAERRRRAAVVLGELFPAGLTRRWVEGISLAVVLLALGGAWGDPSRPYWSCAATLTVVLLIGASAVWTLRPGYVYASGLLLQIVAYLVWQTWLVDRWGLLVWFAVGPELFDRFLLLQILALAAGSLTWSLVEHALRRREHPVDLRPGGIPYAHAAALAAVQLLMILSLAALSSDFFRLQMHVRDPLVWWTIGLTALSLVPCLWDAEAAIWGLPLASFYVLGLAASSLALHQLDLPPRDLGWNLALWLATYVFTAACLIQLSAALARLARRLRITPRSQGWLAGWFLPSQALLSLVVLFLSLWMSLDFRLMGERFGGAAALSVVAAATWLMSLRWQELVAPVSRFANKKLPALGTLALSALAVLAGSWAVLDPALPAQWLHRNVIALAVLVINGAAYRLGIGQLRKESAWGAAGRELGQGMLALATLLLATVLVQEFLLYDPELRTTQLSWPCVALVAALLAGIIATALWLALSRSNAAELSERGRTRCVWGAEFVLVLLLVHLRLNIPDLFPSFLGRNWALVLMFLGFLGVGLAELFQRRGLPALARPVHQTGLFLPLLPLLAYLARPVADLDFLGHAVPGLQPIFRYLERLPNHFALHALLWFLLGLLYALTALLRRASLFALLAALAANFGLWVIYAQHESLAFLLHPQIWLIPVGLILLAAERVYRERLTAQLARAIRYSGLLVIYLSSTADMFITGLAHSVVLPVVLALLAVAGVLVGILLRVRAFVFLGVGFLFLVIFAQIWHAAVDRAQTWVWWASGIVLGAAILGLFALFEKRRNDVLRMLDEFRRWQ
jgi:hypothetical protein